MVATPLIVHNLDIFSGIVPLFVHQCTTCTYQQTHGCGCDILEELFMRRDEGKKEEKKEQLEMLCVRFIFVRFSSDLMFYSFQV